MAGKGNKNQKKMQDFATTVSSGRNRGGQMADQAGQSRSPVAPMEEGSLRAEQKQIDLETILREIRQFRTETSAKSDTLESKIDRIQTRFSEVETRIAEMEDRIAALEERVAPLDVLAGEHTAKLRTLEASVDGQENRGRRNNVRIIGMPEGCEKGSPTDFYEHLLRQLLPNAKYSEFYSVVRAHRTLGPRPNPGAPPRAVLVRFLHYRDRDATLAAAREAGTLRYENVNISIYQDLSLMVQRERKKFDAAKRLLREKGYKYSMLFPARLRVEADGKTQFFTDPRDACRFVELRDTGRARRTINNVVQLSDETRMSAEDAAENTG